LGEVDSGVPDDDVDAGRVVVLPYLDDLPERVGSHSDHVLAAPVANVPQRGDLDLLARRTIRGIDDSQFLVDVAPRTQNRVVVSSARASPGCGRWP
jgi:hypothetical protein